MEFWCSKNEDSMPKTNSFYETIDHIITNGVSEKILHLSTDDKEISSSMISLNGAAVVNFGSCSYLGLEFDERLKNAAKDAISR